MSEIVVSSGGALLEPCVRREPIMTALGDRSLLVEKFGGFSALTGIERFLRFSSTLSAKRLHLQTLNLIIMQESSVIHEVLRKINPSEAIFFKDPANRARLRFRYVPSPPPS